jgi:protein-S-isoprenylcysteine O-methyltransferase Ste14
MGRLGGMWVVVQAILLLLFALAPASEQRWPMHGFFQLLGWMLAGGGAILLVAAAVDLGRSLTPFPRPLPGGQLVTTGVYRFVRHPMYCAALIGALGLSLATESTLRLACTGILFVFFDLKARREEFWLEQQYPAYAGYKVRVKKLVPWCY